jgi:Domain of unknown function (DUF222)
MFRLVLLGFRLSTAAALVRFLSAMSTRIDGMFGSGAREPVRLDELDEDAALTAAARLRATADHAEAQLLAVAAHYADLHPEPAGEPTVSLPGMERSVVMGGEGCPRVAEFAAVELGAALGVSSGAAAALIDDAFALRHRLPRTWGRVLAGEVQAWRARKIAQATRTLSQAAAGLVDARVARIAQSVTRIGWI